MFVLLCRSKTEGCQHHHIKVASVQEFTSDVLNCMESGLQVDAIYTDFCKAFDKVSYRLLLSNLAKLGFGGSFFAWIFDGPRAICESYSYSGSQARRFSVRSDVLYFIHKYAR
jgi:hypothetical protein